MMYVDNKLLYEDIVEWHKRRETNPVAKMGDYTAKSVILIANNLVKRWNFQNYTWRDEMALDAIEVCARYLHKYNTQYTNVHAYITRICERACVNRLKKENKQTRIKYKYYLQAIPDLEEFDDDGNAIQIDYSFFKDIGEKLKEAPGKKIVPLEPVEEGGLAEFID
jgi:hypothetical protein